MELVMIRYKKAFTEKNVLEKYVCRYIPIKT
jgi:hypothetical protein